MLFLFRLSWVSIFSFRLVCRVFLFLFKNVGATFVSYVRHTLVLEDLSWIAPVLPMFQLYVYRMD